MWCHFTLCITITTRSHLFSTHNTFAMTPCFWMYYIKYISKAIVPISITDFSTWRQPYFTSGSRRTVSIILCQVPMCSGCWTTVCKTVRPMLSDRCFSCLSVLSVCDVGALWPNGWMIRMKLGMHVDLGPGHIVLDGDLAPLPQTGPPIFGPYLLQPNGWMDQDATWYGDRPQPRRLCVRWGPRSTLPKNGAEPPSPIFGHFCCGQTTAIPLHASRCHLVWR